MPIGTWLLPLLGPLLAALLPIVLPIARNFEYEYATLNAYLALGLTPCVALWQPLRTSLQARLSIILMAPLVNFIPGFLAFRLGVCPCAEGEMQCFWLIQTLPHLLLGVAAASWVITARKAAWSRPRILCIGILLSLLLFLQFAGSLWFSPQKRSTHILAGFIHGAIYDNWIPLDAGILWARSSHGLLALALLLLSLPLAWKPRFVAALGTALLACWAGFAAIEFPSQSMGLAALRKLMPEEIEEAGFTLHYQTLPNDGQRQRQLMDLRLAARFHVQDLSRLMAIPLARVHIFVYPNQEAKKLWFGGDGTDITDVVTPSVHITLEGWPHPTLRHELVHALASSFAFHGLGFHPNMAFTEGLAVTLAPAESEIGLDEGAAAIIAKKLVPKIEDLFSPLFWGESGPRAYTLAGSMLRYLIAQEGIAKVKALYAGESWEHVLHKSSAGVIEDWLRYLRESHPQAGAALAAEALYRYPGILQDLCPHSKASLAKKPENFSVKFRQPTDWLANRDYWHWRSRLDAEPSALLYLLKQRLQNSDAQSTLAAIRRDIDSRLRQPPKIIEDLELFLLHIDILIIGGDSSKAKAELEATLTNFDEFAVGDNLTRQFWVRRLLLQDVPLAQAQTWFSLLAGRGKAPNSIGPSPWPWITAYLYLRNNGMHEATAETWQKLEAMPPPETIPNTFAVEWWRLIGVAQFKQGNFRKAAEALDKSAAIAKEGQREFLTLAAEEARFREALGP